MAFRFFVYEDEKGKRCKSFAVPATVSTAMLDASCHCPNAS